MTRKCRFLYILISIVICVCINVMFSGKVKAGVEDDIAAAVAGGVSYGDAVTDVINAGADPAEAVIAAITLGGPGVAGEVTTAAISAGGIDVAGAVTAAVISAGGDAGVVTNAAIGAGGDATLVVKAAIDAGGDPDTVTTAAIDAGVDPATVDAAAEAGPEDVLVGEPDVTPEQPQADPASGST